MKTSDLPDGFRDVLSFGLVEALLGRRSRRFFMGAEIPDGVFKYKSRFEPVPLTAGSAPGRLRSGLSEPVD